MTTLEILKAARELLAGPGRWTRGKYARKTDGGPAIMDGGYGFASDACQWCAAGAIQKVTGLTIEPDAVLDALAVENLVCFNDDVAESVDDVLRLFDQAIARLEAANA